MLFSLEDIKPFVRTDREVKTFMLSIDRYMPSRDIPTIIKGGGRYGACESLVALKHYDLDKTIEFYENSLNKDLRKHVATSRRFRLKILKELKIKKGISNAKNAPQKKR